jgi:hypothetical protein
MHRADLLDGIGNRLVGVLFIGTPAVSFINASPEALSVVSYLTTTVAKC